MEKTSRDSQIFVRYIRQKVYGCGKKIITSKFDEDGIVKLFFKATHCAVRGVAESLIGSLTIPSVLFGICFFELRSNFVNRFLMFSRRSKRRDDIVISKKNFW